MKDRDLLRLWAILCPLPRRMWFLRRLIRLQTVTAAGSKSFPTIRMQACAACVMSGRAPRGFCHAVTTRSVRNVSRICLKGSARCAERTSCPLCRALRLPRRLLRRLLRRRDRRQRALRRQRQGQRRPSISELYRMDASGTDLTGLSANMISWKPLDPT